MNWKLISWNVNGIRAAEKKGFLDWLSRSGADPLAVFSMALTMEDVLLRGTYLGIRRVGGVRAGVVEVDWVYNPMPPVPGQVYPPVELKPVVEF
jgi:hypothetical protein